MSQRVRRASLTSLVNAVLAVARLGISAIYVSLLIEYLGPDEYGVAVTVTSIAMWLSIAQMGIGQSLKNTLIRLNVDEVNKKHADVLFITTFVVLFALSITMCIICATAAQFVPWSALLNYHGPHGAAELEQLAVTSISVVIMTVPFTAVKSAYAAHQVEYRLSLFLLGGVLIALVGLVLAIKMHASMAIVATMPLIGNILGPILSLWGLGRFVSLKITRETFKPRVMKPLLKCSAGFLGIELSGILIYQSQPLFITSLLGPAAAATYLLHNQLVLYCQAAIGLLTMPYWQAFGDAWHREERAWLLRAVSRLATTAGIGSALIFTLLLIFGPFLILKWSHGLVVWSIPLALVLCLIGTIQNVIAVYSIALSAMDQVRQSFTIAFVQAVVTVMLILILIRRADIFGVGLAVLIGLASTVGWYLPRTFIGLVTQRTGEANATEVHIG